jgi:hypothetical protein
VTVAGIGVSPEWWVVAVLGLVLAVAACRDVFRNHDLDGGARTLWTAIVLVFPILGPAIYFGVRRDW